MALSNELEALAKRHGATSYRNRVDTQHPAYGFTEDGLNGLIDEVLAKWGKPQPAPLSDDVVKDAARYRWLIDQHWIQTEVDWRLIPTHQDSTIRQLDAAIDAALTAQGGK